MSYSSVQSNQSCRLQQLVLVLDTLLQCHKNIGVKTICCAKDGMMYLTKLANIHDILLQCQTQCLWRCCKKFACCEVRDIWRRLVIFIRPMFRASLCVMCTNVTTICKIKYVKICH